MANRSFAATARKALLRRGRAILRLRQDYSGEAVDDNGQPDYLAGLSDVERHELEQIHGALERIERGVYGRCMSCMDDVERERLQAVPWQRECSHCEEHDDSATPAAQPGASAHV